MNRFPGSPNAYPVHNQMVKKSKIRKVKVEDRKKMDNEEEESLSWEDKFKEENGLKEYEEKVHDIKFICNQCDEKFENGSELEKHLKIGHEEWCERLECNKAYIDVRMLRTHKRKEHGIGIYCKECDVDFFVRMN